MRDWRRYWNSRDECKASSLDGLLAQVGKTQFGQPVEHGQIVTISNRIRKVLDLTPCDAVLDLGCGNGLLTTIVAKWCKRVVAIDYSMPLIATARRVSVQDNIAYYVADISDESAYAHAGGVTKAHCYEALQHLTSEQAARMIGSLFSILPQGARVFLGSIPDIERIKAFYNTDERWAYYRKMKAQGEEQIGHWWNKAMLESLARGVGFGVAILSQPSELYTSHYRFDAVLTKW